MRVANTAALVTGAGSGLGAATASALAGRGATVFGVDLEPVVRSATEVSGVTLLAADVTDADSVRSSVDIAAESGVPLRVVVNCAGIGQSTRILGRNGVHDLGLYARIVQVNLIGTFNVLALAAEKMANTEGDVDNQRGVIINTASVAAFEGQIGQAAYSSSKAGIVGLTLPAARDLSQYGIRVCSIAPGIVDTPLLAAVSEEFRAGLADAVPFPKRLGRPDEFAQLALAIVEHDYLNGEVIRMDGALRMAPR